MEKVSKSTVVGDLCQRAVHHRGRLSRIISRVSRSGRLTFTASLLLKVPNLGHGRVLAAGAKEVAELVERNAAVAALVEELKSFPVVRRGLRL